MCGCCVIVFLCICASVLIRGEWGTSRAKSRGASPLAASWWVLNGDHDAQDVHVTPPAGHRCASRHSCHTRYCKHYTRQISAYSCFLEMFNLVQCYIQEYWEVVKFGNFLWSLVDFSVGVDTEFFLLLITFCFYSWYLYSSIFTSDFKSTQITRHQEGRISAGIGKVRGRNLRLTTPPLHLTPPFS